MGILRGIRDERRVRARYRDALADIPTLAWEYSCIRSQASQCRSREGDVNRANVLQGEADQYRRSLMIHRIENRSAYQEAMRRSRQGHTKQGSIIHSTLVEVWAEEDSDP